MTSQLKVEVNGYVVVCVYARLLVRMCEIERCIKYMLSCVLSVFICMCVFVCACMCVIKFTHETKNEIK